VHQINNKITNYGERITNTLTTFLSSKISWVEILRLWWRCRFYGSMRYSLLRDISKASFTEKLKPCTVLPTTRIASREYLLDSLQSLLLQSTSMLLTRVLITKTTRGSSLATSAFRCLSLARGGMKGLQQPEKWENMWHRLLQLQWYSFRRHDVAKCLAQVVTSCSCT
jgi:hypothetical protein